MKFENELDMNSDHSPIYLILSSSIVQRDLPSYLYNKLTLYLRFFYNTDFRCFNFLHVWWMKSLETPILTAIVCISEWVFDIKFNNIRNSINSTLDLNGKIIVDNGCRIWRDQIEVFKMDKRGSWTLNLHCLWSSWNFSTCIWWILLSL